MKKIFIIANWKENKTTDEARQWLQEFSDSGVDLKPERAEVVICPSFALLPQIATEIKNQDLHLKLGSQDFPAFESGAYTGEESPVLLKEFIQYAIIGHSERRKYFFETDEIIAEKTVLAGTYGIDTIVCVQDENTPIPEGATIVAYEPVLAIGTGNPDTPEAANRIAELIRKKTDTPVIYGGSVTSENVSDFVGQEFISGVLVGSASLEAVSFSEIIRHS